MEPMGLLGSPHGPHGAHAARGVHVAHVLIDGIIDTARVQEQMNPDPDEPMLKPDDIAAVYWSLVEQQRSAWSFELEVRPSTEEFYS